MNELIEKALKKIRKKEERVFDDSEDFFIKTKEFPYESARWNSPNEEAQAILRTVRQVSEEYRGKVAVYPRYWQDKGFFKGYVKVAIKMEESQHIVRVDSQMTKDLLKEKIELLLNNRYQRYM